ncbi:hypothetical protein [Streptosporangium jomthongense]|uniref:Uncharacterized protein n=1 Tax=Streptosporangium jomthongense TaxID=1193683 RepID=A0ABV8F566_9ACTN
MTDEDPLTAAIRTQMKLLDGSLLAGLSPDRIDELGGTGDWER